MFHLANPRCRAAPLLAAMFIAFAPIAAQADDDERAVAAIAEARAKLQTLAQSGNEGAADVEARARSALERAQKENDDGDEDRALHAANEASAYADLAIAMAELRAAEAQRDKLRAETNAQTASR